MKRVLLAHLRRRLEAHLRRRGATRAQAKRRVRDATLRECVARLPLRHVAAAVLAAVIISIKARIRHANEI